MPTTRNHWQSEQNKKQGSASTESPPLEKKPNDSSPKPDEGLDINPRSPKRRKVSVGREIEEHSGLAVQQRSLSPQLKSPNGQTVSPVVEQPENVPKEPEDIAGRAIDSQETTNAASIRARLENLPVLDNLSSQLLSILARLTPAEALTLTRNPDSPNEREYMAVRSLFEHTRRLYRTKSPYLSPDELGLQELNQVEVLRRANQAIFMSSIFTGEIGLRDMNENFLNIFVPEHGRLLKAQGSIYLELKTQAFITARRTGAAEPNVVMKDLFPPDMDQRLLSRRPGAKTLAPSEQDFLQRFSSRRDILLSYIQNQTLSELPGRYRWEDFSREVSAYLSKNFESSNALVNPAIAETSIAAAGKFPLAQGQMEGHFSIHAPPLPLPPEKSFPEPAIPMQPSSPLMLDDFVAQAARAAEIAMQDPAELTYQSPPPPPPPRQQPSKPKYQQVQPQFQYYNPTSSGPGSKSGTPPQLSTEGEIPHNSQSAPTQVLYERARIAATAKTANSARKTNSPSQRRPWTTEEENALMTGLDRVKGPHWSQILAMYGPGGTINESLKDRNQVQLKDKARNLKLFFLKSGIEVPYYLKHVTGDLKTRAPSQASKQEAKEREKLQGEDWRANFDGLTGMMSPEGDLESPSSSTGGELPRAIPEPSSRSSDQMSMVNNTAAMNAGPAIDDMLDVEAMIARAAAQASQPFDSGWGV